MSVSPIEILLVEDNPGDIELARIGFEDACIVNKLSVISDGQHAIDFFEKDENLPDIVLLDINLPKVDGFEILRKIRSLEHNKELPVIMLTSSAADTDMKKSLENNASGFITKPIDFIKFFKIVKSLDRFRMTVIKWP